MTAHPEAARAELAAHWNIALAAFIAALFGSLPSYSFSVLVQPVARSLGEPVSTIALWPMFWSAGCIVMAPFVGGLVDRLGARTVLMGALPLFGIVLISVGLAPTSIYVLLGGAFLIGVATIGLTGLACGRMLASFFHARLGLSLGIMSTGIGASAIGAPVFMQRLVDATSWQWGYAAMGLAALALYPLLWLLTREARDVRIAEDGSALIRPAPTPLKPILASAKFWSLGLGNLVLGILMSGSSYAIILYLTELGLSRAEAAGVAALAGLFTVAGRLGTGWLLDVLRMHIAYFFLVIAAGLTLGFSLLGLGIPWLAIGAFCGLGLVVGAEMDCLAFGILKLFGKDSYGRVYGIIGIGMFYTGAGTGPFIFARLAEMLGGYTQVYFVWSALSVLVGLIILPLRSRPYHD